MHDDLGYVSELTTSYLSQNSFDDVKNGRTNEPLPEFASGTPSIVIFDEAE